MKTSQYAIEIRISETIRSNDVTWFEPYTLTPQPTGGSLIRGEVADQSELYGLLNRLRDFNLSLVSLQVIPLINQISKEIK